MTTDRTLLEDAARAAGLKPGSGYGEYAWHPGLECLSTMDDKFREQPWSPLTDDGDALRLAVKLKMRVTCIESGAIVQIQGVYRAEDVGPDPCAATRRAITHAAADIGKHMREAGNG